VTQLGSSLNPTGEGEVNTTPNRGPTAAQFLRNYGTGEREMPRSKREKVARYYSKVISMALSAIDDGRQAQDSEEKPAKLPSRSYIEFVLAALGFDVQDWTRMGDDEIVRLNTCHIRLTDDAGHAHALNRFKKQRQRTNEWQGEADNPILIEHQVIYDRDAQRNFSEYRVPFGELIRDIIADAPVGTNDYHLKQKVKLHVRAYLQRFEGTAKRVHKTRHPSAMSDANRSASLAVKAFECEARKSGDTSAMNLMRSSFRAAFGDKFEEIFRPTSHDDNPEYSQSDTPDLAGDICHLCGARKPTVNATTYPKKESDENFDEIRGVL
jgi:hypothetical protein